VCARRCGALRLVGGAARLLQLSDKPRLCDAAGEPGLSARLGAKLHAGRVELRAGPVHLLLSGLGGGRRLRQRYLEAIERAEEQVVLAHAYFLPDRGFIRALNQAARRGVAVHLLLAGRSGWPR
jgi:cardiolipin synthase A/B